MASFPTAKVLDAVAIAHDGEEAHDGADEEDDTDVRMVGSEVADLEDDVFKSADCGFRVEARRVADDTGKGFEDGGSGRHDEVAGVGLVPVSSILRSS